MLEHEDIEAIITAPPLWMHADIVTACLNAGKHVLCEKMMAKTRDGYHAMMDAATEERPHPRDRLPAQLQPGLPDRLRRGDEDRGARRDLPRRVWCGRATATGAATRRPPSKDFDASKWGYPTWDHLANWRLYWRYSEGLFAELGSHQVNAANWFLGKTPEKVQAMGGVYRFKDGREVPDHVYATFEYPGGLTGTFESGESNAFEERYEAFYGTKGTLIIRNENEAMLFDEGGGAAKAPTAVEVAPEGPGRAARDVRDQAPAGGRRRGAHGGGRGHGRRGRDLAEHLRNQRVLLGHPLRHAAQLRPREGLAFRQLDDRRERSAEVRAKGGCKVTGAKGAKGAV